MWIRTPDGVGVPFSQVAEVQPGRGFASIKRVDRNRAVNVTASVDVGVTSSGAVLADLENRILPEVLARYPGVVYVFEGMQSVQQESIGGLQVGFVVALFGIFALLAVPLKSYVQPLIIMSAIPFGLVGAIWGHMALGLDVTMFSMMGLVALSGVVVNDSLIMVDFINRRRQRHVDISTTVREVGVARFRPILLTSVTTFVGLAPLMINRSFEAAFLIPMAVSLAFGVMFATFITLVLVPTWYLILEDAQRERGGSSDRLSRRHRGQWGVWISLGGYAHRVTSFRSPRAKFAQKRGSRSLMCMDRKVNTASSPVGRQPLTAAVRSHLDHGLTRPLLSRHFRPVSPPHGGARNASGLRCSPGMSGAALTARAACGRSGRGRRRSGHGPMRGCDRWRGQCRRGSRSTETTAPCEWTRRAPRTVGRRRAAR